MSNLNIEKALDIMKEIKDSYNNLQDSLQELSELLKKIKTDLEENKEEQQPKSSIFGNFLKKDIIRQNLTEDYYNLKKELSALSDLKKLVLKMQSKQYGSIELKKQLDKVKELINSLETEIKESIEITKKLINKYNKEF